MESRDYHEGAKALLDLKKKDEVKREKGEDGEDQQQQQQHIDDEDALNIEDAHHGVDDDESGNNKDDNNVEAAVMRYVGGTLDNRKSNKRKKSFPANDEINEFQHWNAFLETDQLQHGDDFGNEPKDQPIPTPQPKSRKKRKQQQQHLHHQQDHSATSNLNVDPELAQLDDTTEHEQLVRAAILDANQLAQDVNVNIQDYIQQPHEDNEGKYAQLSQQAIDNNIIQAAQVAAAAAAAQERDREQQHQSQPPAGQQAQSQQQIEHQPEQQQQQQNQQPSQQQHNRHQHHVPPPQQSQELKQQLQRTTPPSTQSNSEAAALVAAAAQKASNWVQNQSQGKMFSKEEIEAIDKFIVDYCHINNMTRRQICERVWSNERKKDDFWESLHKVLPYRTRASVYKHVRRSYHIFDVRGKWTPEEDVTLGRLAQEKDGQWKLIGQEMGRMPEDCRDRWRNYVKCGNNRAQNKWQDSEEEKLKNVITEILNEQLNSPAPIINWTLVSEKMGGTRSRIQCRYKWNKILKRDALARAQTIDLNDRIWLLTKLQELRFLPETEIDWDAIASLHPKNFWTGNDFKICYEKMRSSIRDFKKKNVMEISSILLQDLIHDAARNNIELDIPVGLQQLEAAAQAAAAAAAAANNENSNNNHDGIDEGNGNNNSIKVDPQVQQHEQDHQQHVAEDAATNIANAAVNAANSNQNNNEDFQIWR